MLDRAQPSSPLHRSQRSPPLSSFASHCPQPKISFSSTAFFFSFLQRKLMGQCIISMVKTTERTELWKQMFKQTEDRKCMREKKKRIQSEHMQLHEPSEEAARSRSTGSWWQHSSQWLKGFQFISLEIYSLFLENGWNNWKHTYHK